MPVCVFGASGVHAASEAELAARVSRVHWTPRASNVIVTSLGNLNRQSTGVVSTEILYSLVRPADVAIARQKHVARGGRQVETFMEQLSLGGYFTVDLTQAVDKSTDLGYTAVAARSGEQIVDEIHDVNTAEKMVRQLNAGGQARYNEEILYGESSPALSTRTKQLIAAKRKEMARLSIPYESLFAWRETGRWRVGAIVKFGDYQMQYPMYGVWEDENTARQYGYHAGDVVFFSEKQKLPDKNTPPDVRKMDPDKGHYFGKWCFSYEEVMDDPENTYPLLAWRNKRYHSDAPKEYDAAGLPLPAYPPEQIPHPPAPDSKNNTNPPAFRDCPDKDYYWELYCECAAKKAAPQTPSLDAKKFQDYKDYLDVSMMLEEHDPTVYSANHEVGPQYVSTDNEPVPPTQYNANCVRLSGKENEWYDPFDERSEFCLVRKVYEGPEWGDGTVGGDYVTKGHEITPTFRGIMEELRSVYTYYVDKEKRTNMGGYHFADGLPRRAEKWKGPNGITRWVKIWKDRWPGEGWLDMEVEPEYIDSNWYVGNATDNYRKHQNFEGFVVYDENTFRGKGPFRLLSFESKFYKDDPAYDRFPRYERYRHSVAGDPKAIAVRTEKDWYVQWRYSLIYKNKWGQKIRVGYLMYTHSLWQGEDELVMPAGYEWNNKKYNRTVKIKGEDVYASKEGRYNKNTKDYRTDQKDLHERDEDFDKGEAIATIARKIVVAEGLRLVNKLIHTIGMQRDDQYGYALLGVYEAGKRIENWMVIRKTADFAVGAYKGYCYWRETMDIIRDLRDTWHSINCAWDGLLTSVSDLWEYYTEELDWSEVRLTNITVLIPQSNIYQLDYTLYSLQASVLDFGAAIDGLALQADRLTRGNYGPFNPIINAVSAELLQASLYSGVYASDAIDKSSAELSALEQASGRQSSDQAYLSNVTKAAHNLMANKRLQVMNERTRAAACGLYLVEREANQWVAFKEHIGRSVSKTPATFLEARKQKSFLPIVYRYRDPGLFDRSTTRAMYQAAGVEQ